MPTGKPPIRYGTVAMTFHWAIAALIIFNIWFGFYVHDMPDEDPDHFMYTQIHKSIGLTILALALARLVWRLFNPPPPLPATMPGWERFLAKAAHYLLYGLIILVPLAGWATVSGSRLPTMYFGLFEWPRLPFIFDLPADQKRILHGELFSAHSLMATVLMYLIAVHVLAALKHLFVDRDDVMQRMLPGGRAESATTAEAKVEP